MFAAPPVANLLVIRSPDIDHAVIFYRQMGMLFDRHSHCSGPEHYASNICGFVFEIYPQRHSADTTTNVRLGFNVDDVDGVVALLRDIGATVVTQPTDSEWGRRAVVRDFDGHTVELLTPPNREAKITEDYRNIMMFAGCSGKSGSNSTNVDASVPYAADLDPLVGKWASDGEHALTVERGDDQIFVRNPMNDTWRFEISNASAEGSTITFTLKSFLIDGTYHPFNGVPCDAIISPAADDVDSIMYSMKSEHMPEGGAAVLTRLPEGG